MKLINFNHRNDFGDDWYVQVLNVKLKKYYWSLLQFSISWNDYPSTPYLQITVGSNGFFSIVFWVYKFGLDIDLISRTWTWDYLNKLNEDNEQV